MKALYLTITIAVVMLLSGCATVFRSAITITDVRNSVMNHLGAEYRAGRIDIETDKRIEAADKAYRDSAAVAIAALQAYKASGEGDPTLTLVAVKQAVLALIDILGHYTDARPQYDALAKAKTL